MHFAQHRDSLRYDEFNIKVENLTLVVPTQRIRLLILGFNFEPYLEPSRFNTTGPFIRRLNNHAKNCIFLTLHLALLALFLLVTQTVTV